MIQTVTATAKQLPDGMQVETKAAGFKIIFDEPVDFGGTNIGMTPGDALLCALGACQAIVARAFAESQDFTYEDFYVETEGDIDPDGFMGLDADVRNGFQEIRTIMYFKTEESQEKTEAFAKFIDLTCPIGETIANGVKLVTAGVVRV